MHPTNRSLSRDAKHRRRRCVLGPTTPRARATVKSRDAARSIPDFRGPRERSARQEPASPGAGAIPRGSEGSAPCSSGPLFRPIRSMSGCVAKTNPGPDSAAAHTRSMALERHRHLEPPLRGLECTPSTRTFLVPSRRPGPCLPRESAAGRLRRNRAFDARVCRPDPRTSLCVRARLLDLPHVERRSAPPHPAFSQRASSRALANRAIASMPDSILSLADELAE
jgi:hypothetical protein